MTRGSRVVVAAGSNLGDRMAHLAAGVRAVARAVDLRAVSDVFESPAEGGAAQGDYLNLVLVAECEESPRWLLDRLLEIERDHGRIRSQGSGEPRTLDLDLVLHGDRVLSEPGLELPHPRWHRRPFVAVPLLELLPDGVDPASGQPLRLRVSEAVLRAPLRRVGALGSVVVTSP